MIKDVRQLYGIEITGHLPNCAYNMIHLAFANDKLTVGGKWIQIATAQECLAKLPENHKFWKLPYELVLIVNTKNTLHRVSTFLDKQTFIDSIMPGAKEEQFHFNITPQGELHYISIVKHDVLEEILLPFLQKGVPVAKVMLGLGGIPPILSELKQADTLRTQTHDVAIDASGNYIQSIQPLLGQDFDSVSISGEWLDTRLVNPAGALVAYLNNSDIETSPHGILDNLNYDWGYRLKFYRAIQIGVLGFLLLTFISLFTMQVYGDDNQRYKSKISLNQQKLLLLDSLKEQYESLRALWGANNQPNASKASFYIDRIAATVPSDIQLSELHVNPELITDEFQSMIGELPKFRENTINVKGLCKDIRAYNQWKSDLANLSWIGSINTLLLNSKSEQLLEFEISVQYEN